MCIHRRDVTPGPVFGVSPKAPVDVAKWLCNGSFNGFSLIRLLPFQDVLDIAYTVIDAVISQRDVQPARIRELLRRSLTAEQLEAIQEVAYAERQG